MLLACSLLVPLLSGCYVLQNAGPYLGHRVGARSIDRLLRRSDLGPARRAFLEEVQRIRTFAARELGLASGRNYRRIAEVEGDFLVSVVTAAPEFSLEPHLFRFPLVGPQPYMGYYNPDRARRRAARLQQQGLDVWIRRVDAFSSLGIVADPLYSFMQDYPVVRLAELIIHEEAHATLFLRGQGPFNEEFATFVGRTGALRYLEWRAAAGADPEQVSTDRGGLEAEAAARQADAQRARRELARLAAELESLYARDLPVAETRRRKERILNDWRIAMRDTWHLRFADPAYAWYGRVLLNNAFLSQFRVYESEDDLWPSLLAAFSEDLAAMVSGVAGIVDGQDKPRVALQEWLQGQGSDEDLPRAPHSQDASAPQQGVPGY